jgi:nicotinate-nucleotide adenylyltransferase
VTVYAGTFDPIHAGHLQMIQAAKDDGADIVCVLPEPRPRHKHGVKALEHRIAMAQLATQQLDGVSVVTLGNQARFTPHETLPILLEIYRDCRLSLLFGDDVIVRLLDHMADWPHLEMLAGGVEILVVPRSRQASKGIDDLFEVLNQTTGLKFNHRILQARINSVSSSEVRREIAAAGKSNLAPEEVVEYIIKHKLYVSQEK